MPYDRQFRELLNVLTRATTSGSLRWEKTPDPSEFKTRLAGGASVRLLREDVPPLMSGAPRPALLLILLDETGQLLEQWQPAEEEEWDALEELHRIARRSALNVDAKLQGLLDSLSFHYGEKKS
jgi:hypothetical protein